MTISLAWILGLSLVLWVANTLVFHDTLSAPETAVLVAAVAAVVLLARALRGRS